MDNKEKVTTNPSEIMRWAEEREGRPGKEEKNLRIFFPEDEDFPEEISWEKFTEVFKKDNLAFIYQDQTHDGNLSKYHEFIKKEEAEVPEPERESEKEDDEENELLDYL